ncbi:hypothetical protein [Oleiharenicola lentus]|uniref:hypothetical protein n=1 Tax=Oleiharenicola lentus TaxID=2508720 RepID=UPI003F67B86E
MKHLLFLLMLAVQVQAALTWHSVATNRELEMTLLPATSPAVAPAPLVIYLTNLSQPRVGKESDKDIIASFQRDGCRVAVLDYALHTEARLPTIIPDLVKLRRDLQINSLLADQLLDSGRIYIVPSGCRLKRDVRFFRDDAVNRNLAMDIVYPSQPRNPVGAVLEFSCDNANRMGNFSLDFCTDTLVATAALAGHAAAMADHPVAAPYKGFDPMPDVARKIKAAVRTLRAHSEPLGLNGRIVSAGFSRGSGMALMLATTEALTEFEGYGENQDQSSAVQGAVVMSGRFTYLDLLPHDAMIPRYEKMWGTRAENIAQWRAHGALDYLERPLRFPLFLTINATESPEALHQMATLRTRLTTLDSPFTYYPEPEPRGHKMPLALDVLNSLLSYLNQRLTGTSATPATSSSHP